MVNIKPVGYRFIPSGCYFSSEPLRSRAIQVVICCDLFVSPGQVLANKLRHFAFWMPCWMSLLC